VCHPFIVNSLDSLKPPAVQAPTALLLIRGVLTCAPFSLQKEYFKENWINLGVPMVEVIGAEPEPGVEPTAANAGFANEGWLNKLKKSTRNRRFCDSVSLKIFPKLKSTFFCGGPMRQFRGVFPKSVASLDPPVERGASGLGWYAAPLIQFPSLAVLLPELRALPQLNPGIKVALAEGLASW
jgi:hypothetical protein